MPEWQILLRRRRATGTLLIRLKKQIQAAQIRAALSVNRELVLLYWHVGREILIRQQERGWGAKVIDQLAWDLQKAFPRNEGFSRPATLSI